MSNCLIIAEGDTIPDEIIDRIDYLDTDVVVTVLSEEGEIQDIRARNYFRFVVKPENFHVIYNIIDRQKYLFDYIFIFFKTEDFYNKSCQKFPLFKTKKGTVFLYVENNESAKNILDGLFKMGYLKKENDLIGVLV